MIGRGSIPWDKHNALRLKECYIYEFILDSWLSTQQAINPLDAYGGSLIWKDAIGELQPILSSET